VRDHGIENDEDGRAPVAAGGRVHVAGYAVRSLAFARVTGDPAKPTCAPSIAANETGAPLTGVPSSVVTYTAISSSTRRCRSAACHRCS